MGRAQERRVRAPPHPLYGSRERDSSYLSRAIGADHFRQNRPDIPGLGKGPFLLERRVPGRNSVITVAYLGKIRCRQSPPSGSGSDREGGVLDAVAGADGRNGISHPRRAQSERRLPEAD